MGMGFIPKDMKQFRTALFIKKLKVYERKFGTGEDERASAASASGAIDEDDDLEI